MVTAADVRLYLMDKAELNIPLYVQHLDDAMMDSCIQWAVEDFNDATPQLMQKYTVSDFPMKSLLLEGAAVRALFMTAMKELRGEMQYSDGGIGSSVSYKSPQMLQIRADLKVSYETKRDTAKRMYNISQCYGGVD